MEENKSKLCATWDEAAKERNNMGHTPRIDFFYEPHIGFGIRWDDVLYKWHISIAFPFFTITFGLGKDLQGFK